MAMEFTMEEEEIVMVDIQVDVPRTPTGRIPCPEQFFNTSSSNSSNNCNNKTRTGHRDILEEDITRPTDAAGAISSPVEEEVVQQMEQTHPISTSCHHNGNTPER